MGWVPGRNSGSAKKKACCACAVVVVLAARLSKRTFVGVSRFGVIVNTVIADHLETNKSMGAIEASMLVLAKLCVGSGALQ